MQQSNRRRVSFADEVTMLEDAASLVCSPEPESPPQILPVVEEEISEAPVGELIELVLSAPATSLPPPPEFSPFSWLVDDGGMDVDDLCFQIGVDCSPSLSPIGLVCLDVSDSTDSPEVGVLVFPVVDSSPDVPPAVDHPGLPLPSADNILVQDILWALAAPQVPMTHDYRETPVPWWRLAREGPFLAERSPESIHSLGSGCAFRNTTYRDSDYATPLGDCGLSVVHQMDWGSPIGRSHRN